MLTHADQKRRYNAQMARQVRNCCLGIYSAFLPSYVFLQFCLEREPTPPDYYAYVVLVLNELLLTPWEQRCVRLAELLPQLTDPDLVPMVYVALRERRFLRTFLYAAHFFDRLCSSLTKGVRMQVLVAFRVTKNATELISTLFELIPLSGWPSLQIDPCFDRRDTREAAAVLAAWKSPEYQASSSDGWLLRLFDQTLQRSLSDQDRDLVRVIAGQIGKAANSGLQRVA